MSDASREAARDWWQTDIIDIRPGVINVRGYPIADLIGSLTFPQMVWLLTLGEIPTPEKAKLLEAMLVAGVDHGPHAPTIAIARIAITCGIGINNAIGSATNVMGDVHGGAGEQLMEIFTEIDGHVRAGAQLEAAVADVVGRYRTAVTKYVPGFGHRFHPRDPRGPKLFALVDQAVAEGVVEGCFAIIAREISAYIERATGRHVTMNIDGSGAVILAELGFPPVLGRALFVLSRSVGIIAHAHEQSLQGLRNKGPLPKDFLYTYSGPEERRYKPEN